VGVYPDPASAAALAGYRRAIDTGLLDRKAVAVLVLTSSGFKWPDAMGEVFPADSVTCVEELRVRLGAIELAP
jgi:threonine synthase